jgi:hypothetical protein
MAKLSVNVPGPNEKGTGKASLWGISMAFQIRFSSS